MTLRFVIRFRSPRSCTCHRYRGKAFNASMKNAIVVLFLYFLWNVSSFHVGVLDLAFLGYVKVVRARARGF